MKWLKFTVLGIIIVVFVWGFYIVFTEKNSLHSEIVSLRDEIGTLEDENQSLEFDISYFSNPENLLKELKSKFNYREEGEHLIILVPRDGSNSNTLENGGQ